MRVLLVIDNLGSGGAQRQLVTLARGLNARGHEVTFFVYYPDSHYRPLLEELNIPIYTRLKTSRFSLGPVWNLRKLVKKQQYDVVLSFLDTPNVYAELATLGSITPLIVSERFMYPPGNIPLTLRILQSLHRIANFITVNSHHQRERMEREFVWMKGKIATIYNGVDLSMFNPPMPVSDKQKSILELIAIGTIVSKKNLIGLARAMVICRDRYKYVPIVRWVGKKDASREGRKTYAEADEFLKNNKLVSNWEWLGERTDIQKLLREHDALIHPSFYEGLPNVICEALACGRPVLAGNVCDNPKLVQNGISGFLFDPLDPRDIARSIHKIVTCSSEARQIMGLNARRFAEKELSMDIFIDSYENLLEKLVSTTPV